MGEGKGPKLASKRNIEQAELPEGTVREREEEL